MNQRDLIICRGELAFFAFNRHACPISHTLACAS